MNLTPLGNIRVLDFTAMPPGGFCTVILADLGAEVIRVESPAQKGKTSLVIGQVPLSRGKRSMTLDTRRPEANDVLKRLVRTVDIVVENAKPGAMEARGFGYSHARAENKGIIWCAITGFGQSGPYAERGGHDLSYLAHSGLLRALSADPFWQPGISLSLQAGAVAAVIGIQSALLERARTSEGPFLDISLAEAAGWFLTCGVDPLSEHPFAIPSTADRRIYRCADGRFVAVASCEPRTWEILCDALGVPELKGTLNKPDAAVAAAQKLEAIFSTRPATEWVEQLAPKGAVVICVNHGRQLLEDPHILARRAIASVGNTPVPANPIRMTSPDGRATNSATGAPRQVGADTSEILRSAGLSSEEIEQLANERLI
jgi:crotonobetainyl-CoA:carnitine CoA-transferase CaiB-like acyl-CoA transferase